MGAVCEKPTAPAAERQAEFKAEPVAETKPHVVEMPTLPEPLTADLNEPPVDPSAPIDARDIELVQQSWERAARLGVEVVGKVLFMQIFKLAPDAIQLFPFKDDAPENLYAVGSKLSVHSSKVISTVAIAVSMLTRLDELVPVLQELGLKHAGYGVVADHYDVVGQATINSLSVALGPKMTPTVTNAWLKIWTTIKTVMVAAAEPPPPEPAGPTPEEIAAEEARVKAEQEAAEAKKKEDEAAKKKKATDDKKKAEALKKKKEAEAKKKKEEEEKKKAEAEAKAKAEADAAKNAGKEAKKARVAAFKELEKKEQDALVKKLIDAAKAGQTSVVREALEANCDPDQADGDGQTALHYATDKNKKEVVKILLEFGADTAQKVKLGEWGLCPLHYAARQGYKDIAELVFDAKAMKNDNFLKKTPIEIANEKGHDDLASLLKKLNKKK